MWIFDGPLFWFVLGILTCLAAMAFKLWAEDRHIRMTWWKWMGVAAWVVFVGASLAFVGTSLGEGESHAAVMGALFAGVMALVSGAALWRVLHWR
jgi:hypothetical protein